MKPPRWKTWQGVYKGSGDPVFKIPLVLSYFICPSLLVENKMLLVFTENTKSYSNLKYLPL